MSEENNNHVSNSVALDDEQRIKVMSPTMLVVKRFFRNALAIVGLVIIISMFIFSFIGGLVMPYDEAQTFRKIEYMEKDYASLAENNDFRYTEAPDKSFPLLSRAQFVLAVNSGAEAFTASDIEYVINKMGDNFYTVSQMNPVVTAFVSKTGYNFTPVEGFDFNDDVKTAITTALDGGASTLELDGVEYSVIGSGRERIIGTYESVALASYLVYDLYDVSETITYDFMLQAELAMLNGKNTFESGEMSFSIEDDGEIIVVYHMMLDSGKTEYANISKMIVQPYSSDVNLTIDFKAAAKEAMAHDQMNFTFEENGEAGEFAFYQGLSTYTIKKKTNTEVISMYERPSNTHMLGTDGNGMDVLTRLMYGGRVSLIIGFIVVLIEIIFGVVLGGVAGYFGGWVDNLIMRIVDIFNCIPQLPLLIIIGAVMDELRVDPTVRLMYLMMLLGVLGWPYTARIVRGQILSLREQEFMVATEATGISVYRRIFLHLVPNVIPQLIVISTMGLGDVILTEAVLSFLGLGVKYPFASWGNIMSVVSNVYVMTNFLFVWIPAGFCVLITVLGFNFIGDGLRDAFDPKMKR